MDVKNPIIKQIPWFRNPLHTPVAIDFSPTGCFLVVLSKCCNLYILPVCSVFECTFQCDLIFDNSDVTVYTYPFSLKKLEQNEFKSKSPNSNLNTFDHLPQSVSCTDLNERLKKSSNASDIFTNGTKTKQNEVFCSKNKISPSAVCWWQSMQKFQEVAIIGTKSGDIIFVDLVRGMKIGETCVKGEIKNLTVCQDVANNDTFLLVSLKV